VGQALSLPLLAQTGDIEDRQSALLLDYFKVVGISSELIAVTPQLQRDGEFRSKYPAVAYNRRGFGLEQMVWTKAQVTSPERRWAGQNRSGYVNLLLDELWDKALGTIESGERGRLLVEALKIMTEDAVVIPVLLEPRALAYRRGLAGPREPWVEASATLWNVWEWRWT
jgi:ABC-type transport system substrate-binding protein